MQAAFAYKHVPILIPAAPTVGHSAACVSRLLPSVGFLGGTTAVNHRGNLIDSQISTFIGISLSQSVHQLHVQSTVGNQYSTLLRLTPSVSLNVQKAFGIASDKTSRGACEGGQSSSFYLSISSNSARVMASCAPSPSAINE